MDLIVGLVPNLSKPTAASLARTLYHRLSSLGVCVQIDERAANALGLSSSSCDLVGLAKSDVVISLGGDGTLLHTARSLASSQVPILGVNLGHLGFLTELEIDDLDEALERLLRGDYTIEQRLMLQGQVRTASSPPTQVDTAERYGTGGLDAAGSEGSCLALNDIVITRGTLARIITLSVLVNGQHVADYTADGVIIATPTGSTAYSLSAGGPIVTPSLECIIVTPICPHSLSSRSVLVRADERIEILVEDAHGDVVLTADGETARLLQAGDVIEVKQAPWPARLVRMQHHNFYQVVYNRLGRREVRD